MIIRRHARQRWKWQFWNRLFGKRNDFSKNAIKYSDHITTFCCCHSNLSLARHISCFEPIFQSVITHILTHRQYFLRNKRRQGIVKIFNLTVWVISNWTLLMMDFFLRKVFEINNGEYKIVESLRSNNVTSGKRKTTVFVLVRIFHGSYRFGRGNCLRAFPSSYPRSYKGYFFIFFCGSFNLCHFWSFDFQTLILLVYIFPLFYWIRNIQFNFLSDSNNT